MTRPTLPFFAGAALGVAFVLGVLLAPVLRNASAHAQVPPAPAAPPVFRECFAASTWSITGRELNAGRSPASTLRIPAGWTPVGATGPAEPMVLLCR